MITLLDFYAEWCGPCKVMAPVIEEVEKEFEGKVKFKKINVETDTETTGKYGVMSMPTYVVLKDDKEIDRKMGAMPKEVFKEWINSHLK